MASNTASTTRKTPVKMSSGAVSTTGRSQKQPMDDFVAYWKEYAKEKPEVCAMWCLGIGFVIGWKLKPW